MKFIRTNSSKAYGTGYQGVITAKYTELVSIFGQPEGPSTDGKIQALWVLEVSGSVIVTIYDWKEDIKPHQIMQWHIGGKHSDAKQLIDIILKEQRKAILND